MDMTVLSSSGTWVNSVTAAGIMLESSFTVAAAIVVVSTATSASTTGGGVFWLPGSDMIDLESFLTFLSLYVVQLSHHNSISLVVMLDMSPDLI